VSIERPVVLVFVSTGCPACIQLLPVLSRWQDSLSDAVTLATIFSSGSQWEVQRLSEQHRLSVVMTEEVGHSTIELYRLRATPAAVLVTDGLIASRPAEGQSAIESLIRAALRRADRDSRVPDRVPSPGGMVVVLPGGHADHE
jgi:thiol-disulfide isomerase/thioredoxin